MFKALRNIKRLGFTMIELLIVIAVLGILAVAVLASINPIEQINRGRDTGSRSDAEQLISAIDRYYAGKGFYPWMVNGVSTNTTTDPSGNPSTGTLLRLDSASVTVGADDQDILTLLSSGGAAELKSSFTSRLVDPNASNFLSIYNSGVSGESTYVCFIPKSSSFREEAWSRCSNDAHDDLDPSLPVDFPADACPNTSTCATAASSDAATGCYICLP
ncbi:type II secretion system protein [Candidatus Woesebacteria bacterium]|nr:type II secretion system protein [Candidatus Woesebacteria bacterium]